MNPICITVYIENAQYSSSDIILKYYSEQPAIRPWDRHQHQRTRKSVQGNSICYCYNCYHIFSRDLCFTINHYCSLKPLLVLKILIYSKVHVPYHLYGMYHLLGCTHCKSCCGQFVFEHVPRSDHSVTGSQWSWQDYNDVHACGTVPSYQWGCHY